MIGFARGIHYWVQRASYIEDERRHNVLTRDEIVRPCIKTGISLKISNGTNPSLYLPCCQT